MTTRPGCGVRLRLAAALRATALGIALAVSCPGPARAQAPYDPFEPVNRAVFAFNDDFDRLLLVPVAEAWVAHAPEPLRRAVSNFFANIDDLFTGINNVLQGKGRQAADDFGRVLVNSTFGILGLIDIASDAGIPRNDEDFGQTFGWWGAVPGPYLVLPIIGPSSLRDGTGLALRWWLDPVYVGEAGVNAGIVTMKVVDTRAQLLGSEKVVEQAALDRYRFVRSGYLQRRRYLIWDGAPPPEKDE